MLKRQQRDTRRADSVQKRLHKKLCKKCGSGEPTYAKRVTFAGASDFAIPPHPAVSRALRRLRRLRCAGNRRMFHAASFGETIDDFGVGVVVAPACTEASAQQAIDQVLKMSYPVHLNCASAFPLLETECVFKPPLFGCAGDVKRVMCNVVFLPKSAPLFLLVGNVYCSSVCAASALCIDKTQYCHLQTTAMKLLGLTERM